MRFGVWAFVLWTLVFAQPPAQLGDTQVRVGLSCQGAGNRVGQVCAHACVPMFHAGMQPKGSEGQPAVLLRQDCWLELETQRRLDRCGCPRDSCSSVQCSSQLCQPRCRRSAARPLLLLRCECCDREQCPPMASFLDTSCDCECNLARPSHPEIFSPAGWVPWRGSKLVS